MNIEKIKQEWFSNIKGDTLAGIVVALALIPEAIAFSIIAGLSPMVGLYASFCIAIVIAFIGGRPGMISGATGAMVLVMITLIADYGLQYLLAATILTGIIQIIFGIFKLAKYMKFIPKSVMVGFVNALAILIFMAQLDQFNGASWVMYVMVALTLAIIYILPRFTNVIPSTLVAIVIVTTITIFGNLDLGTVGDMGALPDTLPIFLVPSIPLRFETLMIILPYSLALATVGLLESLLTAQIVDDMTDSASDKNKESRGQGIANIVTGFFGGMAGCAMIGQSVINVKSGGKGRLSSLISGIVLMLLIILLSSIVVQIPMAALVGVMFMVAIGTFDWSSIMTLHIIPRTDAAVMVVTTLTVVLTHNLAIGVLTGIVLSALFFVAKISKIQVTSEFAITGKKIIYYVEGELFFVSVTEFIDSFDFKVDVKEVEIDFSRARLWDDSAIGAIDKVEMKYEKNGINVRLTGMNRESYQLMKQIGGLSKKSGH